MNALMKNRKVMVGLIATVGIMAACGLAGWLGTEHTEIDVNSGRLRTRVLVFGVVIAEEVKETGFSRAVARNSLQVSPADYRFASSTAFGPQKLFGIPWKSGKYGAAKATLRVMMMVFDLHPSLVQSERDILAKLMKMLQAGDTRGMIDFVNDLDDSCNEAR